MPLTVQLDVFLPVLLTVQNGRCKQCAPNKISLNLKKRRAQAVRVKTRSTAGEGSESNKNSLKLKGRQAQAVSATKLISKN